MQQVLSCPSVHTVTRVEAALIVSICPTQNIRLISYRFLI
jgi:hypothetical protein